MPFLLRQNKYTPQSFLLRKLQKTLRFPHNFWRGETILQRNFKNHLNLSVIHTLLSEHTMIDFGSNFGKIREKAGLSQKALGICLSLSTSIINRIENNKRRLDVGTVHACRWCLIWTSPRSGKHWLMVRRLISPIPRPTSKAVTRK